MKKVMIALLMSTMITISVTALIDPFFQESTSATGPTQPQIEACNEKGLGHVCRYLESKPGTPIAPQSGKCETYSGGTAAFAVKYCDPNAS